MYLRLIYHFELGSSLEIVNLFVEFLSGRHLYMSSLFISDWKSIKDLFQGNALKRLFRLVCKKIFRTRTLSIPGIEDRLSFRPLLNTMKPSRLAMTVASRCTCDEGQCFHQRWQLFLCYLQCNKTVLLGVMDVATIN